MQNIVDIPLPQRVEVSREVLFQEIEGESVLLNLSSEQYFGLDEVGTRIWHLISENGETEEALKILLKEYNIDKQTLKNDLSALIRKLRDQGLVIVKD